MSYLRAKSRAINRNVYYDNRLTTFTNLPIRFGDLNVEKNEVVGNDLDVNGNIRIGGDLRAKSYYANKGNFYLDNYVLIPYGTIIQCAAVNIPDGWLYCDGSSISKLTYVNLFGAIEYTYGGSGNNFNVPNIQGRVVVGTGSGAGLSTRTLGQTGGEEAHTLTVGEIPAHSHSSNANGGSTSGSLGLTKITGVNTMNASINDGNEIDLYLPPQALTINNTGGSGSHNNMQPFIVFNYLIKY